MKPLVHPTINLNGNTADDLLQELKLVLHNLNHLEFSMRQASDCWHGRNFQTVDTTGATQRAAQDAWHERFHFVSHMITEVRDMAIDIDEQRLDRENRRARDVPSAH